KRARENFTPQIPANPRNCRHRRTQGTWQNSPAPGFRGVISQEKIAVYLPKNLVNLSNFI
ncbi:MAG: hypothetical protein OXG44_19600, partial [Gammaproteobacteria bacterium]|nr:hypothetical protein [Gammaproteobacteria bacterium]